MQEKNKKQTDETAVSKDIQQNITWWKQRFSDCADIKMREMYLGKQMDVKAFLSYIGLGVTPPQPSWGQLIKAAGETFRYYPYQFIIPCLCVSITMLCFNLIGDGLRDALDPKLRA